MGSETAARVREHWTTSGVGARAAATPKAIVAFEARHRLSLPASVADFYSTLNGMEEDGNDDELFVAFPLRQVLPVPAAVGDYRGTPDYSPLVDLLPDAQDYFVFGECMLWAQVLAVRLRPGVETPVLWISGSTFVRVADSFEEFWEAYLSRPTEVLNATKELEQGAV